MNTDHGSIRLTLRRARRGPREAPPATVERAVRTASVTRAAPTADADAAVALPAAPGRVVAAVAVASPGRVELSPGRETPGRVIDGGVPAEADTPEADTPEVAGAGAAEPEFAAPTDAPTGTDEAPALLPPLASEPSSGVLPLSPSPGFSGGGTMPGALVNLGCGASAGTAARPTAARPVAEAPPAASPSTGFVEAPAVPDFA
ncbi:hypothetical protein Afe04nite_15430 [Asanoa ferruginea]|nr:hypothetical protein Afe04nite_15430 [Asanoa ferruginea]